MIDSPRTNVSVSSSSSFQVEADPSSKDAVFHSVRRWQRSIASERWREFALESLPMSVKLSGASRHRGLGSGTQLAFAVVTALQIANGQTLPSAEELAIVLGRGKRSAIGSYGFFAGGFLVDRGIGEFESVAPLDMRIEFPSEWKIVLIRPRNETPSVFGEVEIKAFQDLTPTSQSEADGLAKILQRDLVPGILARNFSQFAESVTEYGRVSGSFYKEIQGGPYASPSAEAIVQKVLSLGCYGVGQSSWGPTLFAIGPDEKSTNWLVEKLHDGDEDVACHATVVSADNGGVVIQ